MKVFAPTVALYRCHQCNWRGYMFRRFESQGRFGFWMTVLGIVFGSIAGIVVSWFLLLRFVEVVLGR